MTLQLQKFTGEYVIKMKMIIELDEDYVQGIISKPEQDDTSQYNFFLIIY